MERFIQNYFARFEKLKQPPFHPKWKEINLAAKVPGWNRYWVAEDLLNQANANARDPASSSVTASPSTNTVTIAVDVNLARVQAAQAAPNNKEEQERLFRQFLEWAKREKKQ